MEIDVKGWPPLKMALWKVSCKQTENCGWPECDCPRKIEAHSPEAVSYAFAKAGELLVAAGFEETAAILRDCKPSHITNEPQAAPDSSEDKVAGEPIAWRWRYRTSRIWNWTEDPPGLQKYADEFVVEPLYSSLALSRPNQGTEK